MRYRACDMGHIHVDDGSFGQTWECPTCGGRLFESDTITALCRKLEGQKHIYRFVECVYERDEVLDVSGRDVRVRGPLGEAIVVTVADEWMQTLVSMNPSRLGEFVEHCKKVLRDSGWEGEVVIVSDMMKFARFEPVEGE